MACPFCRAEQPEPPSRFCVACGNSMVPRRIGVAREKQAGPIVRCGECGAVAEGPRCRGCGVPVAWPDEGGKR